MGYGAFDAVIFDWGGTLTPWHDIDHIALWHAYTDIYHPSRAEELAHELFALEDERWGQQRDTWGEAGTGSIDYIFDRAGIDVTDPLHVRAFQAYLDAWDPHTFTHPEVPELYAALHTRGLKVGVLSNTTWPRWHHEKVFRRDGVFELIDGAVYSSETPTAKPHRDIFHAAMATVGVTDASRAIFVGDRPWDDVHGAQQVGMLGVLVPHSNIPTHQAPHELEVVPDGVITNLLDLLPLIDEWAAESL